MRGNYVAAKNLFLALYFSFISASALASSISIGTKGIKSSLLNLTGANIGIGQLETGRPGIALDGPASRHEDVVPTAVFRQDDDPNFFDASEHGTQVAGVMISKNTGSLAGVAPEAKLYASAIVAPGPGGEDALKTIQHVDSRNGGDIRAVNHSYGLTLDGIGSLDGSSYFTMGLDWATFAHNVLHVVAGNEGFAAPFPSDNYNGVTIAASKTDDNGNFRIVADFNTYDEDAEGIRTSIDLLAPGDEIELTNFGTTSITESGTSFAAPHVTGTVALLQEYGDDRTTNPLGPQWHDDNWRRHEVMKAVLLNSADKLIGVHGSERTVVSRDETGNYDWLDSPAALDVEIPLDLEFGAGHLNAQRALKQFESGEWDPFADIPLIGWDLGETGGTGTTLRYPFAEPLVGGEYIALTLAWDRKVDKTGSPTTYNTFDIFTDLGVNDLDLYLLPVGWTDLSQAADRRSISFVENVEHVFAQVPTTGNYEIVVNQSSGGDEEFALAWWFGNPFVSLVDGDFDGDGDVDGQDFLLWQRNPSVGDLTDWQNYYGFGTLAAVSVPEPSCLAVLLGVLFLRRHRS